MQIKTLCNRLRFPLVFMILGLFLFSLCSKSNSDHSKERILLNLSYGKDLHQKMDIYLVSNRTLSSPLVILVHGGGWMNGDKQDASFLVPALLAQGCNVVNVNYRLANGQSICYPEIMEDLNSCISFLHDKANNWNIRKTNFVFWGGSAGAHLALLYAYSYDHTNSISSVIGIGSPTRLDYWANFDKILKDAGLLEIITCEKLPEQEGDTFNDAYKLSSPYYGKNPKPTLLAHGEKDDIVPVEQSEMLYTRLVSLGVDTRLYILPNAGHIGENASKESIDEFNKIMIEWIKKYS